MSERILVSRGPVGWAEFLALGEDDLRELVDGELLEVDVPDKPHEHAVAVLVASLFLWAKSHGGLALPSGYKVRISEKRGVMPDVQFYRRGNPAARGQDEGLTEGRPDLVVEVVSRTSRRLDRVVKLNWYAALGVPEYWIVDPEIRTMERLTLHDGKYAAETLADDALFRPESFEGLEIPLAELWLVPAMKPGTEH
jgi:Uma2 family endonuclease